jgi:hypothetical protein
MDALEFFSCIVCFIKQSALEAMFGAVRHRSIVSFSFSLRGAKVGSFLNNVHLPKMYKRGTVKRYDIFYSFSLKMNHGSGSMPHAQERIL